jgi:propionate CoA-transferase
MPKLVSATHAVKHTIESGNTIVVGGFINQTAPVSILKAMNTLEVNSLGYFCTTGVVAAGVLNMDMFNRATAAHYGLLPNMQKAIADGKINHRIIPQGVLTEMLRTGKSVTSKIGKKTFLDNTCSDEITYTAPHSFDVALVRAKKADKFGNVMLHDLSVDTANAIKTCNISIVEVDEIVEYFEPYDLISKNLMDSDYIDYIVLTEEKLTNEEENNLQTNTKSIPEHIENYVKRIPELLSPTDKVVNLGIGLPEASAPYLPKDVKLTVEAGIVGGTPRGGKDFGISDGEDVQYFTHNEMFHMYWDGLLDVAVMGVGEFDYQGNVNVHDFGKGTVGTGGFVDITQSAKKVIFCGKESKLVDQVRSVTFSPDVVPDQEVYYLTEKAIYVLDNGTLVEYS